MLKKNPNRRPSSSEEGYILIWVIFLLAVFTLWLSVAVPRTAKAIQRDREVETMHRGKQYVRAVQLYFKKFHAYPPNADALSNTNEIRFLRKKYIDPTTGKDDWKAIRFGQNKTPTAMGFFGQPLAGSASTIAGTGPTGGGSGIGNGSGGSSIGSSGSSIGSSGSSIGTSSIFSSGTPGASSSTGSPAGGTASSGSSSDTGLTGQTFGGAGIIGFSPAAPRPSILIYKKKSQYNEWEFVYDPLTDMRTVSGGNTGMIGQPAGSTNGVPGLNSSPTTSPTSNPSPGPGSSPGSGSAGPGSDPGTPPAPPQQ
jgi:type II secretory pathway pseudopilin PulG